MRGSSRGSSSGRRGQAVGVKAAGVTAVGVDGRRVDWEWSKSKSESYGVVGESGVRLDIKHNVRPGA
jgi:hypothetical protein